ncbi:glycosyltransferase family 4 protein [Polynucleobacter sp. JS-Mosq-20-D10]|uniref:glycosyltransferase family 4 protein n=1 Tax=Polynucleobacter sp. JS-Mosq-20-D10 TaxID=2576922 RepID=UPI001BFDC79F|nr:glycosyltransferase family 4 protein [Polynucleobacter sp. JS-Mosq-20-D10]QWE00797.1 glycosyltransferase family 4 protein [Polynucleobacter sp. JS-Mosq-20-D10]
MPKILIVANTSWNIINFRANLIRRLVSEGYEVVIAAGIDQYSDQIQGLGARFVKLRIRSHSINLWDEFLLLMDLMLIFRKERPVIFLGYTIKPNIYGSLAAIFFKIPTINNIAGLGTVFVTKSMISKLVSLMYKLSLSKSSTVFFQNKDDLELFTSQSIIQKKHACLLPGSGVDLKKFKYSPIPASNKLRFLLIARLLWDKGVGEFAEAARILKQEDINVEMCLLGFIDSKNSSSVPKSKIDEWVSDGLVTYLGVTDNVREEIAKAHCVVLPSYYREGTPRALLEGAAMGRPIIAADSIGCRDVVDDGVNGYLCRPKDAYDLANKISTIASMEHYIREQMGLLSRKKVRDEFDEETVINAYLDSIRSVYSN